MTSSPDFYYIKVPIDTIFDDLSDPVFRSVCKLLTTAREFRYMRTPEMTIMEMAELVGLSERAMWGHLSALRQSAHVSVVSPRHGHYVLHFPAFANDQAQDSANHCSAHVVVSPIPGNALDQQQQKHPCRDASRDSAKFCTDHAPIVLLELADMAILEPTRSELASCSWASPDYAVGWGLWKKAHPEVGAGVIIQNWRMGIAPPSVSPAELAAIDPQSETSRRRYISGEYADLIKR